MLSHYVSGNPSHPMVVLVHGVCDVSVAWVDLINHLTDRYFVVALDSLGHGTSPRYSDADLDVPGDAGIRAMEETLIYLEELYGKKPVVIGHSMGAAMSSKLSTLRPELFAGLILEDPAWLSDEQAAGYRERAGEQVEISEKLWRGDPSQTAATNCELRPHWDAESQAGWGYGKALVDPRLLATGIVSFPDPWREIAAKITVPTVVITSDTDEVLVGTAGVQALAEIGNPAISVEVIPSTGHGVRLDAPEAYHAIVDRQLAQWCA